MIKRVGWSSYRWGRCAYQVYRVDQSTPAGSSKRRWDATDRIQWYCVMCILKRIQRSNSSWMMRWSSNKSSVHPVVLYPLCAAAPVNRHVIRHPQTPDACWLDELCSWWSWIRSNASPCPYNMPAYCTATPSAHLDLSSPFFDGWCEHMHTRPSRMEFEHNLRCDRNLIMHRDILST